MAVSTPRRIAALVCAMLIAGCTAKPVASGHEQGREIHSNVRAQDYAGSTACSDCHAREAAAFAASPMHRMTRALAQTEIEAPFTGPSLQLGGDVARLATSAGERRLELEHADGSKAVFQITKVIGGRYREDFVGVELDRARNFAPHGEERVLPLSYLIFNRSLRYKGYSVLVRDRPGLEPGQVWRETCIFCHNTAPQLSALFDELHGPGSPSYQGSASDDAPPDRRFRYRVLDEPGLAATVREELERIGADTTEDALPRLLEIAMRATREQFGEGDLIELGIGCEACHGGAREHARAPQRVKPSFALESPFFRVEDADGSAPSPALAINRTCAKCHTVLFSRYPYTWEGGRRHVDPGGSPINSGEARDFLLGDCRTALSCTSCHDPHTQDSKADLARWASAPGDALCTRCHQQFATPNGARAHSHHAPESSGSHCLSCHMPKKNLGLAYELTRYHRIGSPNDVARVELDRPLECALCHGDKSVEQIVSTMERWWPRRFDRDKLRRLYGHDLSIDPLRATLIGGLPHERAVAASAAAEQQRRDLLPLVLGVLDSEYPLVRFFAKHAAETLMGRALPVDAGASPAAIAKALSAWRSSDSAH